MPRRRLPGWLDRAILFVPVVGALAIFHFWGEAQREREWWWLGGGPNHMTFLDLSDQANSEGHLLLVDRAGEAEATEQLEYEVEWDCGEGLISMGEAWTKDEDLQQIERLPAPDEEEALHAPKDAIERDAFNLACATADERVQIRTFRVDISPVAMTQRAFSLVDRGVQPHSALFQAAGLTAK
jgi:hypothetical protein